MDEEVTNEATDFQAAGAAADAAEPASDGAGQLSSGAAPSPPAPSRSPSLDLVIDLPVRVSVELGRAELLMRDVLELGSGSVIELDRGSNDPVDLLVNGRLIARGDLTSVDERLAIRIVELIQSGKRGEGT